MSRARPLAQRLLAWAAAVVVAAHVATAAAAAPTAARFSHADFDAFLRRHVDDEGSVDYAVARTDRADLDRYLAAVATASPDRTPARFPTPEDRLAYFINAYNASVIAAVLRHYPIASVRDVRPPRLLFFLPGVAGFFLFQTATLGGEEHSLYALENDVIRKRFAEPRVHFALNCASRGCPRLPAAAFTGEDLDAELEREARRFVREPRNVAVDPAARTLRLSSIFDWYEDDFTSWMTKQRPGEPATLARYVAALLPPDEAAAVLGCADCRVEVVPYDWALNDQRPATP